MAHPENEEKNHELNRDLYSALMRGDGNKVIEHCKNIPQGPLHKLTIHKDTVLHMATYSKQKQLVLQLLQLLPDEDSNEDIMAENDIGNTILHEAATCNTIVLAAKEMLRKAPELLRKKNKRGETALFRAARYGKMEMFKFLDDEVNRVCENERIEETKRCTEFYQRKDNTTILHISILTEHFDLAFYIAKKHKDLVSAKDGDEMTALQLLACNPSAFNDAGKRRRPKRFINYSCVSIEDTYMAEEEETLVVPKKVESCCRIPLWGTIQGKNQRYESAARLAKYLIAKDTSWEATASAMDDSKPRTHKYGSRRTSSIPSDGQEVVREEEKSTTSSQETIGGKTTETPLFLATKSGILEIVEEILHMYPQAVEHIDHEGRNILHVAIKYRQIHIFDFVEKLEIPMRRLLRKINNDGNSILHMVGTKTEDAEDMRSPALLLREDLLLFERVKKISTAHFIEHFNNDGLTADKLFAKNNAKLRTEAKEWLKRTAENCSIVAVLIATVAFAAAYTVPGGPNQNTGYPLLQTKPFFVIFTLTDVLSLAFALTAVITFLSILTSSFQLKDFRRSLPQKLMLGLSLLILSVSMMMLAFAATVILLLHSKEQWIRNALYSVAFFPVCIFALSYLPLYIELMKTFMHFLKKIGEVCPRYNGIFLQSWLTKSFGSKKNQSPDLSNPTHYHV
ncbi:ankyrin repeat-containing protein At5g02620-like isoform X1 [Camellia sinensis]|uniref:ankyrin repeat-containing protein At5g02620-like isoform X1 n=1 Tax=Camellia sinensis TaxID=4442 RepID=UPI001036AC2E|nr:ankyrin repeat-containing protein At5g02620-like isoform X1 [Camellia sinensis]